ncbi:alanine/glycine:cation symporter family protein [Facklamia miroungae]|uniref:Alanine or glycine:cation symporter, AGCS family n=1 Tax=Facklamia miroungae TaxID=120956 RepID=A0A1G7V357_9LACT|nr:sodium:alanine symporter family protein [Facklamia miroungae]NKZ30243.1 alanine:cation symporter family protein [Facklamia miroungae]SDG53789.1 alanine or glycine:cation symporter, AGCS family [Facklamia miroungae]
MSFSIIIQTLRDYLWDFVLLYAFIGIGVFMTLRLGFPQFSRVFPALKRMISDILRGEPAKEGEMTPFQSLATAVAAQVGTGNIVGIATAIISGGPGAAFWMLVSGFLGMATIFVEASMAQVFREREGTSGNLVGGPAYYIKNGLKQKWLAYIFAVLCIIALGIVGIMVQANSIISSLNTAFGLNQLLIACILMIIVGWILIGGMERIGKFSEKVVPTMATAYVLAALLIVFLNLNQLLPTIKLILTSAFNPQAIAGGALGISIQQAMRYGLARGLFSNEAGMGSTPHSHAVATTSHPAEQGFIAMVGVFICTFIICVATVMINLLTGAYTVDAVQAMSPSALNEFGQVMTQTAFQLQFGKIGESFLAISLSCFSLTTIVGWFFFAESNVKFIFKNPKIIHSFKLVALISIALGYFSKPGLVWDIADLAMGLMALPNIVALIFLSGISVEVLKDYDKQVEIDKEHISWDYKYEKLQ